MAAPEPISNSSKPVIQGEEAGDLSVSLQPNRQTTPFESATNSFQQQSALIADLARLQATSGKTAATETLDFTAAVDMLSRSAKGIAALNEGLAQLNRLCDSGVQRQAKATLQLAPLIVRYVAEHTGDTSVPTDVSLFARVFANNSPAGVQVPGQIRRLLDLVDVQQVKGVFPKAMHYIAESPASASLYKQIVEKIEQLESERNDLAQLQRAADRGTGSPVPSSREDKITQDFDRLMAAAAQRAGSLKDIDLKNCFPNLYDNIAIHLVLKPDIARTLHEYSVELSNFFVTLAGDSGSKRVDNQISIPLLTVTSQDGETERFGLKTARVSIDVSSDTERSRVMLAATEAFLSVRETLLRFEERQDQVKTRDFKVRRLADDIRLDMTFLLGRAASQEMSAIIATMNGPEFSDVKTRLFTSSIVNQDRHFGTSQEMAFESPKNIAIYRSLTGLLLSAPNNQFAALRQRLGESPASGILLLCDNVREFMARGNYIQLAAYIDRRLDIESKNTAGHLNQSGLLFCMEHLAENKDIASAFKTRLRRKELIEQVSSNLQKILGGRDTENVIPASAKSLVKRLNVTLEDYLGHKKMIEEIRQIFDRNALFIKEPNRLDGLPAKLAILNAFLLHGPPGVGKTFLVKCIANSYGLEILPISREEMERFIRRPKVAPKAMGRDLPRSELLKQAEPEADEKILANQLAEFMAMRIKELQANISKSKAGGGIIFLDEMEAEFFKRDQAGIERSEVERTNIMLRVIETAIENNPEIYFFGATNYISMVDPAALRLGRFGVKFKVDLVSQESAEALLTNMFQMLSIEPEPLKASSKFADMISECVGTVPQVVQLAVANEFLAGSMDVKESADSLVTRFTRNLSLVKRLIAVEQDQMPA